MIALGSGLHVGLLHHPPSVRGGIPYFAATAGIAGQPIPIAGDQSIPDKVERIEVLCEDDDTVPVSHDSVQSVLEHLELAVHGDLAERGDVVLQVESLLLQRPASDEDHGTNAAVVAAPGR